MASPSDGPFGTPPLKRDPALVPLSRDHHFALMYALGLRRAGEARSPAAGVSAAAEAFLAFYDHELLGHMADEEQALLPGCASLDAENVRRLRQEHEEMSERVAELRRLLLEGGDARALMRDIGERLHDHVRFEERVFFECVQSQLSRAQLEALGRSIEEHRKARGHTAGCFLPRRG